MAVFDINGNDIGGNPFLQNSFVERGVFKGVVYHYVRINKVKYDGETQYPFVISPNGMGGATQSTLQYARQHKYPFVVNAGTFWNDPGEDKSPRGMLIVNGSVLNNEAILNWEPLTIDSNGNLGYVAYDADAYSLSGIVSAVLGVGGMLINNYVGRTLEEYPHPGGWNADAQRQIIGQFGNGDYAIVTAEGRGFDNSSPGWLLGDAIEFCVGKGMKFAYNLDGGGSTETVVGKKQLNTIYEGTYGRIVPTFIVFNGSTIYGEPDD